MPLDPQQLVQLAQRFYPPRVDPSDPNGENSPELKAYQEAWERAPSIQHWFEVVGAMKKQLPGLSLHDATPGRSCGAFRCFAHLEDQNLAGGATLETVIAGYRSVLAPVYGVIWVQRIEVPGPPEQRYPWRAASVEIPEKLAPIADVIANQLERQSGFQRLSPEMARIRVPDIIVESIPLGEATLFDALLDYYPTNIY